MSTIPIAVLMFVMPACTSWLTPPTTAEFMRDLSKAIFALVPGDADAVRQHHAQSQGHHTLTPEELQEKGSKYLAAHCRRLVRPAAELLAELQKLMDKYRDAHDPDLGNQQLFHALYTDQVNKAVLDLINSGSFCGERDGAAGARSAGLCVL